MTKQLLIVSLAVALAQGVMAQDVWTLQSCIDYALEHNIQIQKNRVTQQEGEASLDQYRNELFPSLSFGTNHGLGYRPFEETTAIVQNGQVTNTSHKVTYNGSYGLNANWTVWNGGINRKNIQAQELQNEIADLTTQQSELAIREQIAMYYVQILYTQEAKAVNEQLLASAQQQFDRGKELLKMGQMSKADLAQLEAQLSGCKYNIVSSETQVANYKRQLKALLELDLNTPFDVATVIPSDAQVLALIPSAQEAYEKALASRPEIKIAEKNIDAANLQLDIAKRGYYPSVGVSASLATSNYSASQKNMGEQLKSNINASAGVNISVPIFDNHRNLSSVKKAKLRQASRRLDLQDQKNGLSSTIEQYWLSANSNQQNFIAAQEQLKSQRVSYELLDAQFKSGLKNIAELLNGRDNLISAEQRVLEAKYTTLLNVQLLKFYTGEELKL